MRNRMNFSKVLGLNIRSHSEISFIDVVLNDDTKLFIDPCLLEIRNEPWYVDANNTICSFFKLFYELYNNGNDNGKLQLFSHAHEINATKLGYGNGRNGKAKTAEGLLNVFRSLETLLQNNLVMSHPMDLAVFIRDFAEDCLSDMITNILFKCLNDFTLEQCQKLNIPTEEANNEYYYWDNTSSCWNIYIGPCLKVNGEIILLVPKNIVRNRYYYCTSQYFRRIILEHMQEERQTKTSEGKIIKPTKKELKKDIYASGNNNLSFSIEYTKIRPHLLNNYHDKIPKFYHDKGMTDRELDCILYGR